ncbi:MAG: serine/threonine protein kinase [Chloroflexi bacterium]|nr:MAG: serine/threonine protein kinase [Chloroflexota bacterium]
MILRTIGQGGMGAVYKAQDLKRRTVCAIKEMSLSMVPPEDREKAILNFKTEAQMLSSLKHPNLPSVAGYFAEGPRHFLVMEYIEGLTLDEYLLRNDAPFSEGRVLGWARQLCDVLTYLHSQHPPIIFRDMKPGNIMLMRDGRVKLIDFGIARFFRFMGAQDTQLLGTPGYAPPEQYGKAQTDKRSDIYSLAMTLFQLMTNTLSEKGFGLNDVHTHYPFISLPVARALEKATSLAPEDRFQNAEDFRRALFREHTFLFENGEQALTAEELAKLSARFSDEAADYLFSGEIEDWLRKIGDADLAWVTRDIRNQHLDPYEAIDLFLHAVLGPNVHILTSSGKQSIVTQSSHTSKPLVPPLNQTTVYRNNQDWTSRKPMPPANVPDIVVQPLTLDFGEVFPGISDPLMLTISDERGTHGTIATSEPWIQLDETSFDGINTHLSVVLNTTRLRGSMHYTGTIVVMPDEEDEEQDIVVKVEVDVLGNIDMYPHPAMNGQGGGEAADVTALDEEDYEDPIAFANGKTMTMAPQQASAPTLSPQNMAHYEEYKAKYGDPFDENRDKTAASGCVDAQLEPHMEFQRHHQSLMYRNVHSIRCTKPLRTGLAVPVSRERAHAAALCDVAGGRLWKCARHQHTGKRQDHLRRAQGIARRALAGNGSVNCARRYPGIFPVGRFRAGFLHVPWHRGGRRDCHATCHTC